MNRFERSSYTCKRDKCPVCEKKKFPQYLFCRTCYMRLTPELRRALWNTFDGSAYKAALEYLRKLQGKLFW